MSKMVSIFFFLSLSLFHIALGELVCEELPAEMCSFAIASSGNRCLLETTTMETTTMTTTVKAKTINNNNNNKEIRVYCKTSNAKANVMSEYIESDSCINTCAVDKMAVGISSDKILDFRFLKTLCSSTCLNNCPNIADLYHNLALGEGTSLPDLCKRVNAGSRRAFMLNLSSKQNKTSSPESDQIITASDEPKPPEIEDDLASAPESGISDQDLATNDAPAPSDDIDLSDDMSDSPAAVPEALVVVGAHRLRFPSKYRVVAAAPV